MIPLKATAMPRRCVSAVAAAGAGRSRCRGKYSELMAEGKVWVERLKPNPKQLNIRPYLRKLEIRDNSLLLDLWVTQTGTARADELLKLLSLADLLDSGVVVAYDR